MRLTALPVLVITLASVTACDSPRTVAPTTSISLDDTSTTSSRTPEPDMPASTTVGTSPDAPDITESLVGPVWWLESALVDGSDLAPKKSIFRRARFQFVDDFGCERGECRDGITLVGNDACNDFFVGVTLDEGTVTTRDAGEYTAVDCGDDLTRVVVDVLAEPFDVDVRAGLGDGDTDRLVSTSADATIELTMRTDDDPFGPTEQAVVTSGRVGDVAYRLTWEGPDGGGGQGGTMEFRDTTVAAFQRNSIGVGIGDDFPLDANFSDFGTEGFLFGVAPIEATQVEYQAAGREPALLTLFDAPGATAVAFAETVPNDDEPGSVVSYDADGNELVRLPR